MSGRSDLHDRLLAWAERLDLAAEVLRRRSSDVIAQQMVGTVESVAEEMRLQAAHVSTWPAPGGDENG